MKQAKPETTFSLLINYFSVITHYGYIISDCELQ